MIRLPLMVAATLAAIPAACPAFANDSTAELGTGGLILSRTDAVAMDNEVLSISPDLVSVDYVFRNVSDKDVDTVVAFPMPEIAGNPYDWPSVPKDPDDNFLGFSVMIDGKPEKPVLEQKAFALGVDVTADLKAQNIPLFPHGDAVTAALNKIPDAVEKDWIARGIIVIDEYDAGMGWQRDRSPYWSLRSTYWWRMTFPVGKAVAVSHRYTPSLGTSAGLGFFIDNSFDNDESRDYVEKYCLDDEFKKAVERSARDNPNGYPDLYETRLSYILRTGGNWATGAIGDYTLTVDKGEPDALVSFCGEGVRKTGPTTFEMKARDYYPARDIDILILKKPEWDRGGALDAKPVVRRKAPKANPAALNSGG